MIAKSGTRDFLQALTGDQRKDAALIGQFGVGFYSGESGFALNVAHRVNVSFPLFLDASLGAAPSGNWGGRVGIGIEF